jgi:Uma2 family endonuclease
MIVRHNGGADEHQSPGGCRRISPHQLWQASDQLRPPSVRFRPILGILALSETRIQINPRRYRIPDISVWRDDNIGDSIPTVPPFLAIEILSPEDRMTRVWPKIQEYLSIGVEFVWVIDLEDKSALTFSRENPVGIACDVLRTSNPAIEIPLSAAFDLDA